MINLKDILQSKYLFNITFIIFLLFSFLSISLIPLKSNYLGNESQFIGEITKLQVNDDYVSIELSTNEIIIGNYYYKNDDDLKYIVSNLKIGSTIKIKGELKLPLNNTIPNLFNYRLYLKTKHIKWLVNIKDIQIIGYHSSFKNNIQNYLRNRIKSIDNSGYMLAFILGDTSYISDISRNYHKLNGTQHILAISGMHVSLIVLVLYYLLNKLRLFKELIYIITIIFILIFLYIIGFQASLLRSVLMYIFLVVNKLFNLKIRTFNIFCIVGVVEVLLNQYIIYDLGFIYSFICAAFLMLSNKIINNSKYKSITISIISFFVTIPVTIHNNFEISLISILINIILVPYATFYLFPLSIFTLICPFLIPIYNYSINIFDNISHFFSTFKFLILSFPKPCFSWYIVYYLFLIYILIIYEQKKKILKSSLILVSIIALLYFYPYYNWKTEVYFLDVGQGDSILIKYPFNQGNVLIDTGGIVKMGKSLEPTVVKKQLIPFFKSIGIRRIDVLILTHGDYDHIGEAVDLINYFKVEKVYFNRGIDNEEEITLMNYLKKKDIPYLKVNKSILLNFKSNKLYMLIPDLVYNNENDNSTINYGKIGKYTFLFTGDISKITEQQLINDYPNLKVDILKIAHHGSSTSTSEELLLTYKVKLGVISSGRKNMYGHPHQNVIDLLSNNNIPFYNTQTSGAIYFCFSQNRVTIKTYKP